MSSVWNERAAAYRESETHREGPDLDLLVEWAAGAGTALDMQADVQAAAEHLPFADASFDVVATRVAAHHFADVAAAIAEMARVAADRVLVVDNLFMGEAAEEADRLRDPSHVRNYTEAEWRALFEGAGLSVVDVQRVDRPIRFGPWLERSGCADADAVRVRELLADRIEGDAITLDRIALLGRKSR